MTGTAVNPACRAQYLAGAGHDVTLVVPWVCGRRGLHDSRPATTRNWVTPPPRWPSLCRGQTSSFYDACDGNNPTLPPGAWRRTTGHHFFVTFGQLFP